MIVAKIIALIVTGSVDIGKIIESISLFLQIALGCCSFPLRIKCGEDRIIPSENPVDRSDRSIRLNILFVIIGAPALITTKLLVGPTPELLKTFEAFSIIHNILFRKLYNYSSQTCITENVSLFI